MSKDNSQVRVRPVGLAVWPNYRTIWRWHFYAGLFCIPFVMWLAATGSVYLFKPQVESWLERPYDRLILTGPSQPPSAQVKSAMSAVPGTVLRAYELPQTPNSAARVIVSQGTKQIRVYVRPDNLQVLKVLNEDDRFMRTIFRMHGELLIGDRGSYLVELAACWAIVMLITGLLLWWPRGASGLAGVAWPRFGSGPRQFWRDLHAVTGFWVSFFALFLLLTGLPWAKNWGGYLKEVRKLTGTAAVTQDWTNGRSSELAQRRAQDAAIRAAQSDAHADHLAMAGMTMAGMPVSKDRYAPLDLMVPTVSGLHIPPPVLISPPSKKHGGWTAKSDTPNRPQRVDLTLDAATGAILQRTNFSQRHWIDQVVGTGVAAHEGQLFGPLNQALGVFTALGLMTLSGSALVMWLRKRPQGRLGAPEPAENKRLGVGLGVAAAILFIYLPLLGISAAFVIMLERLILQRIPAVANWLGLRQATT